MLNNYLATHIVKNTKPFVSKFGCPLNGGEICFTHEDCVKKDLFLKISNFQKEKYLETDKVEFKQKKQISELLAKAFEKYQQLIDNVHVVGLLFINNDDGTIVNWNHKLTVQFNFF
jgi:hypothetical protein